MKIILLCTVFIVTVLPTNGQKVHAHNDYQSKRPFWAAFEAGAASIEVDVFLQDQTLFVTHDKKEIISDHTLELMYLQPLEQVLDRIEKPLQILIDIKSEANSTLKEICTLLESKPKLLNGQIKFVISGNRPAPEEYLSYPEFIFFDHQSIDKFPDDISKIALVSLPFYRISQWKGEGLIIEEGNLTEIIKKVHSMGLPIRFWATPDEPLAWLKLKNLGLDFINTDKPENCVRFFK